MGEMLCCCADLTTFQKLSNLIHTLPFRPPAADLLFFVALVPTPYRIICSYFTAESTFPIDRYVIAIGW